MIRRILGISIVSASLLAMGCSSSDDDADPGMTTDGMTTDGMTTDGGATYTAPDTATGSVLQTVPAELVTALNSAGITDLPAGTYTIFSPCAVARAAAHSYRIGTTAGSIGAGRCSYARRAARCDGWYGGYDGHYFTKYNDATSQHGP